jgi:hypothetical protein
MINGTARRIYLKNMELRDNKKVLFLALPIRRGRVSPIIIKLIMLKIVPKISPLPTGFCPAIIKRNPIKIAAVIALVEYFFWVSLIDSIIGMVIFFIGFSNFKDLAINDDPAADNAQYRKNSYKYTSGSKELIQIPADKKTKKNTTDHGQTKLRNYGKIFNPRPVFFIVEKHVV